MARGRMLNKSVAIDRRLNSLSLAAHWLYMMTLPHLDRDGLIAGDAPLLAAVAMPRRPELHAETDDLIAEWVAAGLVVRYDSADTAVLFFRGFAKNQVLQYAREAASEYPPPPGYRRTTAGLEPDAALTAESTTLEQLTTNTRVTPYQNTVKLSLNEVKINVNAPPARDDAPDPALQAIRNAYDACGLMLTKTHLDAHRETITRTGLAAWQTGFAAALQAGKQNIVNYVTRCAESAMIAQQQKGNGNASHRNPGGATGAPHDDYDANATLRRALGLGPNDPIPDDDALPALPGAAGAGV